jgi:hypothetical protein
MEEYFSIRVQTFFCQTRPFRLFQHNLPKADYRPISEMRRKREFSAPASTAVESCPRGEAAAMKFRHRVVDVMLLLELGLERLTPCPRVTLLSALVLQ